jgi:hypothetical protein
MGGKSETFLVLRVPLFWPFSLDTINIRECLLLYEFLERPPSGLPDGSRETRGNRELRISSFMLRLRSLAEAELAQK